MRLPKLYDRSDGEAVLQHAQPVAHSARQVVPCALFARFHGVYPISSTCLTCCCWLQAQHKRLPKPYDRSDSEAVLQHAQGLARGAGQEGDLDKVC